MSELSEAHLTFIIGSADDDLQRYVEGLQQERDQLKHTVEGLRELLEEIDLLGNTYHYDPIRAVLDKTQAQHTAEHDAKVIRNYEATIKAACKAEPQALRDKESDK